jgi:hypothetical protein
MGMAVDYKVEVAAVCQRIGDMMFASQRFSRRAE